MSLHPRVLLLGLMLSGCTPSGGPYPDHKLSTLQKRLFDTNCAISCHQKSSAMISGQLDLSVGHSYAALVNVAAKNVGAIQDNLMRVKPGDAEHSLLYIKIAGHTPIAYGTPMPQSGLPVSPETLAAVRDWINDGAKDD